MPGRAATQFASSVADACVRAFLLHGERAGLSLSLSLAATAGLKGREEEVGTARRSSFRAERKETKRVARSAGLRIRVHRHPESCGKTVFALPRRECSVCLLSIVLRVRRVFFFFFFGWTGVLGAGDWED